MQLPIHVSSHSPVFVSRRCLYCFVLCATLPAAFFSILLYCSRVLFLLFVFPSHHSFLEFFFCFIVFWPPSCPFLLSSPSREVIRSFILLYHSTTQVVVSRTQIFFYIIVDVCLVRFPPWPDNVIQLCLFHRIVPVVMNFSNSDICCISFLVRCALTCSNSTSVPSR